MSLYKLLDTQLAQPKWIKVGQVEAVTVTAGGTGYVDGAAATFSAPSSGVTATGTIVAPAGIIAAVVLTNPGSGYTAAPTVTVATGADFTYTVSVASIEEDNTKIIFVDQNEAQEPANRAKGIKTPGWNKIVSYTDADGNVRNKVEVLVAGTADSTAAGDRADDAVVADAGTADNFSITVQPVAVTVVDPATANFTVTALSAASYQWQVQVGGAGAWSNTSTGTGGTTNSYTTAATTALAGNGNRYRVIVTAASGATITSKAVKLTVTA